MAALLSLLFPRQQAEAAQPRVVAAPAACARRSLHVPCGSEPSQLPQPRMEKEQVGWSLCCPLSLLSVVQHAEIFRSQPVPQCKAGKKQLGAWLV